MRKKTILVLVLLLLITGCSLLNRNQLGDNPVGVDYRKGTGGLEIGLIDGLPPKEVFEGNNFKIALRLKNSGAYDIKRGTIEIAGFDEKYVSLTRDKTELKPILGKSIINPEGDYYVEEFDGVTSKSLGGAKEYRANYYVVAKYDYKTEAQTEVCVNTNLYSDLNLNQGSCKPEQSIKLSGQGAPVAIKKIEQVIIPSGAGATILFKLYVENSGKGEVVGLAAIEEVKLSNRRLRCEPNVLDLKKKEDHVFVCTIDEAGPADYTAPFYASLYYTYQIQEKKEFIIKSLGI